MRDRGGNVAIVTALCCIPMFGMLGFAIDYGIALSDKVKLDNAADTAALVAIKTAQTAIQGGATTSAGIAQGQAQGALAFAANAGSIPFAAVPTPAINIGRTNQTLTASVSYQSVPVNTNFSKIIGIPSIPINGSSTATLSMTTYINYYIIVDISQSMGVGSTATDMQNLYNRVVQYQNYAMSESGGCVFGCHVAEVGQQYTNEYLAHNVSPTITLRIDAAVSAIQNIITQAQTSSGTAGNIKIGLYTMSDDPITLKNLNTVAAPTSNFSSLTTAAATIDLGNNLPGGSGDTNFSTSLQNFASNVLGTNGDGSSASSPLQYVFMITDGVQDTVGACPSGHCVQALNPSICTPLQANATVGVIYTTYLPVYNNNNPANGYEQNYQTLVYPIASQIAPSLQSCASSPNYYIEATNGPAITTAMSTLFQSTTAAARISK
jgi:Flp pilus assembly protein TadG